MRMTTTNLQWRKASWPDKTYHARRGAYSYTVDHDGGGWRLRTWKNGTPTTVDGYSYGDAHTASGLQQIADDHAAANG